MATYEKISADEARAKRAGVINEKGMMAKGVSPSAEVTKAPKFNVEARSATFVMSAETADRMGDVVVQEGLDTTNFEANPQGLLFHNSRNWPIGKWSNVSKNLSGRPKRTEGTLTLLPEGKDADADRAAVHLEYGTLKTVSIGFMPNWDAVEVIRDDEGRWTGFRFNEGELYECSLVPVPALPAATMKELSAGMLSQESLELIKGILDNFEVKDGKVVDRDGLEHILLDATGRKTFSFSKDLGTTIVVKDDVEVKLFDMREMPAGMSVEKLADGTLSVTVKDGGETDTEETEGTQKPDPVDQEKQKAISIVREHGLKSKEPGLFAKMLNALTRPADVDQQNKEIDEQDDENAVMKLDLNSPELVALRAAASARLTSAKSVHSIIESGSGR